MGNQSTYEDLPSVHEGKGRLRGSTAREYSSVPVGDDFVDDDDDAEAPIQRQRVAPTSILNVWMILYLILAAAAGAAVSGWWVYRQLAVQNSVVPLAPIATVSLPPRNASCAAAAHALHYNSHWIDQSDPFDSNNVVNVQMPTMPFAAASASAFFMQPHVVNNTLVFVSEGDMYLSSITSTTAVKLTTTVGNVRTPKLHPSQALVAFTATYAAHRDVYLLHLASSSLVRLTYGNDSPYGVSKILQWKDETTLVIVANNNCVGLDDLRMYELHLTNDLTSVLTTTPVPLSQAVQGSFGGDCLFFVRVQQSSQTVRYVGGTAENLWQYCNWDAQATPLTADYNGTSKEPTVSVYQKQFYLLFLSDRSVSKPWQPTTMNLWIAPVSGGQPIPLTRSSCQFHGLAVREYTVDSVSQNVILRIGADLYLLTAAQIVAMLEGGPIVKPQRLAIQILSDFHEQQERLIPVTTGKDMQFGDVMAAVFGTNYLLATIRGQVWALPTVSDIDEPYNGGGQNLRPRRYRILPGSMTGGSIRVLKAVHVPVLDKDNQSTHQRFAIVLATDPLSSTAEHALYLIESQTDSITSFQSLKNPPKPFLGGHVNGGSTKDGGLGSVLAPSLSVSPCGRRLAWTDTDGRICVMTVPLHVSTTTTPTYQVLPSTNELGEPMDGTLSELVWSPGGRYLAVVHSAKNQFQIVSIVDCGDPLKADGTVAEIQIGRIAQVTPSRFNSFGVVWGKSSLDYYLATQFSLLSTVLGTHPPEIVATTLYFLTDRDVVSDVMSPWGSRMPSPHFPRQNMIYALPLDSVTDDSILGRFAGGGALEVFIDDLQYFQNAMNEYHQSAGNDDSARRLKASTKELNKTLRTRRLTRNQATLLKRFLEEVVQSENRTSSDQPTETPVTSDYPVDMDIDFGPKDLSFARRAYRLTHLPKARYEDIVSQTVDDGSLLVIESSSESAETKYTLHLLSIDAFPSDDIDDTPILIPGRTVDSYGVSSCGKLLYFVFKPDSATRIVRNLAPAITAFMGDAAIDKNLVDTTDLAVSVWPALEYHQLYSDAWRLLRDYFYDRNMHGVDWPAVAERYLPLVARCRKREELDDVLSQMASELSALHVFVYGGEYSEPFGSDGDLTLLYEPASLGATLERTPDWYGYTITEIPERDPDFSLVDNHAVFCPLSDQTLRLTGQKGLQVGDVIVAINGESVMHVPDIFFMLRGMAGRSVRLEVLRLASSDILSKNATDVPASPLIVSPITPDQAHNLRLHAWEWKTRQLATELAANAGFSVAYIHLRAMGRNDEDAFARNFFPDYDKEALILDVRHNSGGNIDSWILSVLQRKAWMYWSGRNEMRNGDMDWDEQFAFRGHIVVLIDEHTGSDAEGVSRGISELGLGRLIGKRTWGGGIWLSSDNILVDGGIASAPEYGVFNTRLPLGLGIENQGVQPDIEVDNDPHLTFLGKDVQMERAIQELAQWLKSEPVVVAKKPTMKDISLHEDDCPA